SVHWLRSQATPAAQEAELAAEHARRAGDDGLHARALSLQLPPLVRGPGHLRELAARLDELERAQPGPYLTARITLGRAWLALFDGRFADGREFARRAIDHYVALGIPILAAGSRQVLAETELAAGNLDAARKHLSEADPYAASTGEKSYRSTLQAIRARVEALAGDHAAARDAIELSDQLSAPVDVVNFAET